MISTVTTSTITIVTAAGSFAVIGIFVLLALLVQKELVSASNSERAGRLGKILDIGIVPLLIAFVLVVVSKVGAALK